MTLVAGAAAVLTVVSLAAFGGRWWWVLDLAANFRPHLAALLAASTGLLLVGGRRRWATLAAVGAVANLAVVVPLYVAPPVEGVVTAESLRVVSFNLKGDNRNFGPVADFLAEQDADVVFLHEATRDWSEAPEIRALPYRLVAGQDPELVFGTLVLVPEDARVVCYGFAEEQPRSVEVTLTADRGTPIRILGVHPVAPSDGRRAGLRDAQLLFAARWASSQDSRVVVVGDFNATPWSWAFRRLLHQGGLTDSMRGFGLQATYPADRNPLLRIPIDHLVFGEGLVVADRRLGPALGSDHLPLVVDLVVTR